MRAKIVQLAALFVLLGFVNSLMAQQPLAQNVPADAMVYVGWQGKSQMGASFSNSKLKAYIDVMNFNLELARLTETTRAQGATEPARQIGMVLDLLPVVWDRPWAFYVRDLISSKPDAPDAILFRSALLIDAGDQAKPLAEKITSLIGAATPGAPQISAVGNWTLLQWNMPELEAQLAKGGAVGGARLADDASFKAAMTQTQQIKPVVAIYFRPARMLENYKQLAQQLEKKPGHDATKKDAREFTEFMSVTGLDGLQSISYCAGFDGPNWSSGFFIEAPVAKRSGWVKWYIDAGPLSPAALTQTPSGSVWVRAMRFNPTTLWDLSIDSFTRMEIAENPDADPKAKIAEFEAQLSKATGLSLRNDLLTQFGEDWVISLDPAVAGPTGLGFVLVTNVKDAVKLEAALSKLEEKANEAMAAKPSQPTGLPMKFQVLEQGGVKIHLINLVTVAPSWAVHDNKFYLSLLPQAITNTTLAQPATRPQGEVSLIEQAKKLLPPGALPTGLGAANLSVTAPTLYNYYIMLPQILAMVASQSGVQLPPWAPPPLAKITPLLDSNALSVSWADDMGYHARTNQPFPTSMTFWSPEMSVSAPMPMMVGIMLPAIAAARRTAQQMQGSTKVREIQGSCMLYASEHDGAFPPDLATLVENSFFPLETILSPRANTKAPANFDSLSKQERTAWINANASFVLLAGNKENMNMNAQRIDLVEKQHNPSIISVSVAWNDNHVSFETLETIRPILLKQTGKSLEELGIVPAASHGKPAPKVVMTQPVTTRPAAPVAPR